jgi:hypothetical protein
MLMLLWFVWLLDAEWEPHHDEYAAIGLGGQLYGECTEDNFDFEFGLQEVKYC